MTGRKPTTRCGGCNLQYRNRLEFASAGPARWTGRRERRARRATRGVDDVAAGGRDPADPGRGGPGRAAGHGCPGHGSPARNCGPGLRRSSAATAQWLDEQAAEAEGLPEHLREIADEAIHEARQVQQQLAAGLDHVVGDPEALRCFRFMNQVMATSAFTPRSRSGAARTRT